jgi:hypothetical protein
MLSPIVMSVVQVFSSIWCWVWLVLSVESVGFPSVMIWGDVVRFNAVVWARFGTVETVGIHQVMWFVMLESAKDRVIGVDTPGQQVPPRVRYRMACPLIRDVVGSVPYSDEWEIGVVTHLGSHGAKGRGTAIGIVTRPGLLQETLALLWYCDYLS